MKRLFTAALLGCFCFALTTQAQVEQGKWMIGLSSDLNMGGSGNDIASMGFSTTTFKSDDSDFEEQDPDFRFGINMLPKVGVFVINNLAIGLETSLAFSNTNYGDSDAKYSWVSYSMGPFIRYYIPTSTVKPFFETAFVHGGWHDKYTSDDGDEYKDDYGIWRSGSGAGVAIPIGTRASFDAMLRYNWTMIYEKGNEDNDRTVTGTFGFKFGFIVFLGG